MPTDRSLLLISLVLQGTIALTFGLAFFELWRAFRRGACLRWSAAWLVYAIGVLGNAFGFSRSNGAETLSPAVVQVAIMPLIFGVILFRAGTDALADPSRLAAPRRYLLVCGAVAVALIAARSIAIALVPALHPEIFMFIAPRLAMAGAFAWGVWPLMGLPRREWREGYALLVAAMCLLSIRTLASAGYEVWQLTHGAEARPESLALTIAQVCLMIVFGLATAVVLIQTEQAEAMRAAHTIRRTAEALVSSEERFRFVVEHSSDLQMLVGANRRVRYAAPSCERLIGLPASAIENRDCLDLVRVDDRDLVMDAIARMQSDPAGQLPSTSVHIQHQSGEWRVFDVNGQSVPGKDGEGPTLVLSAHDVTTQRQLERALLQSQRLDTLGQMAGSIAHDFNNTLTAILGGLELVAGALPPSNPAAQELAEVEQAALRGSELMRQLLAFARQLPASLETFDAEARVDALEGMILRLIGRAIDLQVIKSGRPLPVRADPSQFDQALVNLATNARDAMPDGGRLTIRTGVVRSADSRGLAATVVRISVEDTGLGIPAAIVDRVFEPFFTTKPVGQGTGLGLASAYGFARQSKGLLTVESTEGVGARFILDLPLES